MFDRIVKRTGLIQVYSAFREVSREQQESTQEEMPGRKRDPSSLFLGKRQVLCGALARYVAVERYNVRASQTEESHKRQQRILGRLPECFSLFDQQTCPLRGRLGFRRGMPFDMLKWVYECKLKANLFATKRRRAGQGRDLFKRTCELLDGLNQRRTLA